MLFRSRAHILLDGFGTLGMPSAYRETLEQAGCVMPPWDQAVERLLAHLPGLSQREAATLRRRFKARAA